MAAPPGRNGRRSATGHSNRSARWRQPIAGAVDDSHQSFRRPFDRLPAAGYHPSPETVPPARGDPPTMSRSLAAFLLILGGVVPAVAGDGNRLAHLDRTDAYYVSRTFP